MSIEKNTSKKDKSWLDIIIDWLVRFQKDVEKRDEKEIKVATKDDTFL